MNPLEVAQDYVKRNTNLANALCFADDAVLDVEPLAQGEHNANFILFDSSGATASRYVLRINYTSQLGLKNQIAYEFNALETLKSCGRTPEPLYVDDSYKHCKHGVLVEEYIEGNLLCLDDHAQINEVARTLADVHAAPVDTKCVLQRPCDPVKEQLDTSHRLFRAYAQSDLAEDRVLLRVSKFFAMAESAYGALFKKGELPSQDSAKHIINTEAVPSHFIFDAKGQGHMVDWEKPIIADPAQDVAYFLSPTSTIWDSDVIFSCEERKNFIEEYERAVAGRFPLDRFYALLPIYAMSNALIGITWSCNALVEYLDPSRPLKNEKTKDKLGTYIDDGFLDVVERLCFDAM